MLGVAVGAIYQTLLVPGPLQAMCVGPGASHEPGPTMEPVPLEGSMHEIL